ncbi:MAG: hypothetical protein ACI8UO_002946 [Verrucomicrobiales bacterium]|jgi:hypothetical protein
MTFRPLLALIAFAIASSSSNAQQNEDPDEWVIEVYQMPGSAMSGGHQPSFGENAFLKPPPWPADEASDKKLKEFIRESNRVATHNLKLLGLSPPIGSLFIFDPKSLTLAARLPRSSQDFLDQIARSEGRSTVRYLAFELTIFEAPAAAIRDILKRAPKAASDQLLLTDLHAQADAGNAKIVAWLNQEAKSGQSASLVQESGLAIPRELKIRENDSIDYATEDISNGVTWEIYPLIGADGSTSYINLSLSYPFASPAKRMELLSMRKNAELSVAVTDLHRASVVTGLTLQDGEAKLIGVWKPEYVEGRKDDMLQAGFVRGTVVSILPPLNPRVQQLLAKFGENVVKFPEGPPQWEDPKDKMPAGMIGKTFYIPPGFTGDSSEPVGQDGPVDPFAELDSSRPQAGLTRRMSVQNVLESQGVDFPPGSSAWYIPGTAELTVVNQPENIELIEAYVRSITEKIPKTIGVTIHVVQAPAAWLRKLGRESLERADHTEAWAAIETATAKGETSILRSLWIEGQSGQRSKIESGRDHGYHAGAESTAKADSENPAIAQISGEEWMTGIQKTQLVGTSVEVDPLISADGQTIDLNFSFSYDYAPPTRTGAPKLNPNGGIEMDAPATSFHQAKVTTSMTIQSGATRMIGTWKPTGAEEFEHADLLQAVFIRADVRQIPED